MAGADEKPRHSAPLAIARAFGVTFGGPTLLVAGVITAAAELGRATLARRRPRRAAVAIVGAAFAYEAAVAPWMRHWGTSPAERRRSLPGDELVPDPEIVIDHGVTIEAPPESVWPWLAQIGQDRGGFYSYEWLENLAGCKMRNAERIHPEWQRRAVGDPVVLHPAAPGVPVTIFQPGRAIGLEGWGVFLVEPVADDARTRLIARGRIPRGAASAFYRTLLEIPHFVMQRKMLLDIKQRAEEAATQP